MEEQIKNAISARNMAHCPYSNYKVGACLKTKEGKLYTGCNIENNGISSICAERVAFVKALSEGEKEFESIVVVGGKDELETTTPCGYCRQFMSEFVDKEFKIIIYKDENNIKIFKITELLPHNFSL